jgi:hypothetical protein
MKKLVLALLLFSTVPAFADNMGDSLPNVKTYSQSTASTYTNYSDCIKLYRLPPEKLFHLALTSVNANKFEIIEMQTRNNYVIFKTGEKEFLLQVLEKDKYNTYLKLSPCDNSYYFAPSIPQKIFNSVNLNYNLEVKEIKF